MVEAEVQTFLPEWKPGNVNTAGIQPMTDLTTKVEMRWLKYLHPTPRRESFQLRNLLWETTE